jgi:hypothetical protein
MLNFVDTYKNEEKFNDDFIFMKRNDDVLEYIQDICSALEVIDGIRFLGAKLETDESKFKTRTKKNKDKTEEKWMTIEDSRLNLIKLKFEISDGVEKEIIDKEVFYPKVIEDFFFELNGSRYFPILQIIDSSTYHTPSSLTLKTLLMPIIIRNSVTTITDTEDREYRGRIFILNLFKHKINILYYYLAQMGFKKTLEYFGFGDGEIFFFDSETEDFGYDKEEKVRFDFNPRLSALVSADKMKDQFTLDFLCALSDLMNSRTRLEKIHDKNYWKKKLGVTFTKNTSAQSEKAEKILLSFGRILDNRTKKILRINEENKVDTFSIARWMMKNHDQLMQKDNMDLANKRIRLHEYLLNPLLMKFSTDTYRLLNSKSVTMASMRSIFNTLHPGFIVKKLLKSNSSSSNSSLLRYYNAVNEMHLYTSALKVSFRGPQSISEGVGTVSDLYRGLNYSYVGRLGLAASSPSDPGLTATCTPFIETHGFYFTEEEEIK